MGIFTRLSSSQHCAGLKDAKVKRTQQKSRPFYCGIDSKVDALDVIFGFIDLTVRTQYKDVVWQRPSKQTLRDAVTKLVAPPKPIG